MIEFAFFDDAPQARFLACLAALGIAAEVREDPLGARIVGIAEDLPEDALAAAGAAYDRLLDGASLAAGRIPRWSARACWASR